MNAVVTGVSPSARWLGRYLSFQIVTLSTNFTTTGDTSLSETVEFVGIRRANRLFDGQATEVGDALEELLTDFTCGKP
jgi:hypothetical protein